MKRNVENPDFGSDSIFFAFPIKRINFWGLQHTCTAAACKNRCIKLIRLFSPGRAVYWVLFVYFGHQSSKKEIDQIGIGRIALWQTNAPFNLMCSHAIFGNTCNMSLLLFSHCLKNPWKYLIWIFEPRIFTDLSAVESWFLAWKFKYLLSSMLRLFCVIFKHCDCTCIKTFWQQ